VWGVATRLVLLLALSLAVPALAAAAAADKPRIQYNAVDQAAARATTLRVGDLGGAGLWKGGAVKPDFSGEEDCPYYDPKQSDLVVTGAAATEFELLSGVESVRSETWVMKTARMMELDWQRSVQHPQLLRSLRDSFEKGFGAGGRLISVKRLAFPRITARTAAFRVTMEVAAENAPVRFLVDFVAMGSGRSEMELFGLWVGEAPAVATAADIRLARILASRARA
jgi:hypothetical protein